MPNCRPARYTAATSPARLLAALLMLAALLAGTALSLHHIDHDCSGEDCPVCAILATAATAFRTLVLTGAGTALLRPLRLSARAAGKAAFPVRPPLTLVAAKVKLTA